MVEFWSEGALAPAGKRSGLLSLRPLRVADAKLDYDAVMSSASLLRSWSASDWPADNFTLAGNVADLERHQREHEEQKAFTYTVQDKDAKRCLGCVYVQPVWPEARPLCKGAVRATTVGFWVRASELRNGLDRQLLLVLLEWFRNEWPFDCVLFTNAAAEARQETLLTQAGLERLPLVWPDGRTGSAFRATWARNAQAG